MKPYQQVLTELVELSHWLGAPEQDCAILGEGNTSARVSDTSFLVKASGTELGSLQAEEVLEVDLARALAMLDQNALDDQQVREMLIASKVHKQAPRLPSVETSLHAVCLSLPNVHYVGHSHPTAINAITCSHPFEEALQLRLFPDQIVVCGPRPLLIPYIDPGVALARTLRQELAGYCERWGETPKTIYLQNHGLIALGATARQVKAITAMAVKAARILLGSYACGGPRAMRPADIDRIHTRPDEHYRQRVLDRPR